MSMVSQALLVIMERVLTNRTWAEDRVWQQPIDPISELLRPGEDTGRPVLAVYVEQIGGEPAGLETQRGVQEATIKIMGYIAPSVTFVKENTVELKFDAKGAGIALNLLARQIEVALHTGDADWLKLFRNFVVQIQERKARFVLIEIEAGLRIPCIEVELKADVIPEPEIGQPLYGYWLALDTKLRCCGDETTTLADLLKRQIEGPDDLPSWAQFQATTNLRDETYVASGLGAIAHGEDGPVEFEDIVSQPDIEVVVPGISS